MPRLDLQGDPDSDDEEVEEQDGEEQWEDWPESSALREDGTKKRAGPVPPPPKYDGDLKKDPRGLKKYRYQIKIWQLRPKFQLTPEEQALALLSGLEGDAAEEFLEMDPETFFVPDGVDRILKVSNLTTRRRRLRRSDRS